MHCPTSVADVVCFHLFFLCSAHAEASVWHHSLLRVRLVTHHTLSSSFSHSALIRYLTATNKGGSANPKNAPAVFDPTLLLAGCFFALVGLFLALASQRERRLSAHHGQVSPATRSLDGASWPHSSSMRAHACPDVTTLVLSAPTTPLPSVTV